MNGKLSIFISHKHQDEPAASGIRDILSRFDDPKNARLQFFLSEEIPGDANWYEWIKQRLVSSSFRKCSSSVVLKVPLLFPS
jgi:hypothetical protein